MGSQENVSHNIIFWLFPWPGGSNSTTKSLGFSIEKVIVQTPGRLTGPPEEIRFYSFLHIVFEMEIDIYWFKRFYWITGIK